MEKSVKHKKIVHKILKETVALFPKDEYFDVLEIVDEERGQYLIYTDGREKKGRDYGCFFHIHVKPDGKVYLRHDGTDLELAMRMIKEGIDKKDIVLAFQAPVIRELTDFALA